MMMRPLEKPSYSQEGYEKLCLSPPTAVSEFVRITPTKGNFLDRSPRMLSSPNSLRFGVNVLTPKVPCLPSAKVKSLMTSIDTSKNLVTDVQRKKSTVESVDDYHQSKEEISACNNLNCNSSPPLRNNSKFMENETLKPKPIVAKRTSSLTPKSIATRSYENLLVCNPGIPLSPSTTSPSMSGDSCSVVEERSLGPVEGQYSGTKLTSEKSLFDVKSRNLEDSSVIVQNTQCNMLCEGGRTHEVTASIIEELKGHFERKLTKLEARFEEERRARLRIETKVNNLRLRVNSLK